MATSRMLKVRERLEALKEHEIGRVQPLVQEAFAILVQKSQAQDDDGGMVRAYEIWSEYVVTRLLDQWWDALVADSRKVLEDSIIESVPEEEGWRVLLGLGRVRSGEGGRAVAKWSKSRVGQWLASAVCLGDELEVSAVVDAWARLPRVLTNSLSHFDIEPWKRSGLEASLHRCREHPDGCSIFFNCIATKCKLLGWTGDLISVWLSLGDFNKSDADLLQSIRGTTILEALVEKLLLSAQGDTRLLDVLFSYNKEHTALRTFLATKVALGRPASLCKEPSVAALCCRLCVLCDVLGDSAVAAAGLWREHSFVLESSEERRLYVSLFLYYSLRKLRPLREQLQVLVLPGVSTHMESNADQDRQNGMLVGEAFAAALHQDLHFDDLPEKHRKFAHSFFTTAGLEKEHVIIAEDEKRTQEQEESDDAKEDVYKNESVLPPRTEGATVVRRTARARRGPDDAVELSGSESEDEQDCDAESANQEYCNSSSDSEELEPYDLTDDGLDLEPVQPPKYLREVLSLLQTKTEADNAFDNQEAALKAAEKLIRSRPADIRDQALQLAQALASLDNKFDMENFQAQKSAAMIALAASEPAIVVGRYLAPQCVTGDITVSERDAMLRYMAAAAYELAGRAEDNTDQKVSLLLENGDRVQGKSSLVPNSKSKTRRWGYRRNAAELSKPNHFGDVAARHFFFPVLYGYISEQGARIREESTFKYYLQARILQTLSVFADAAQNTPPSPLLATHLLAFAWSKVTVPDASVRRSALAACLIALSVVPEGPRLLESNAGTLNLPPPDDLHAFALTAAHTDPDPGVRSLASSLTRICPPSAFNISLPSSTTPYNQQRGIENRGKVLLPPRIPSPSLTSSEGK